MQRMIWLRSKCQGSFRVAKSKTFIIDSLMVYRHFLFNVNIHSSVFAFINFNITYTHTKQALQFWGYWKIHLYWLIFQIHKTSTYEYATFLPKTYEALIIFFNVCKWPNWRQDGCICKMYNLPGEGWPGSWGPRQGCQICSPRQSEAPSST